MAKSKYAPALFEVINRQKNTGKLGVPKWWKGGSGGPQPEGGEPGQGDSGTLPQAEPAGPESQPLTPASPQAPAATALNPAGGPTEPPTQSEFAPAVEPVNGDWLRTVTGRGIDFRVESGRLSLSLSPVHAAVICGGLLIMLIAAYQVGKGFASPVADKNGGLTLLDQKPNAAVLDSPAGRTDAPPQRAGIKPAKPAAQLVTDAPPAPPEQEVLKVGLRYVLLDTYPRDALKSAEYVQKWLASAHKIQTVIRERKDKYWLVGVDGFDFSKPGESDRCTRFVEKVKSLGGECKKELIHAELPVYALKDPMVFVIDREK